MSPEAHEPTEPALRMAGITKIFGGARALDDVAFEVGRGEVHCLAGENGCGKSTLIKIISGVYTPEPAPAWSISARPTPR